MTAANDAIDGADAIPRWLLDNPLGVSIRPDNVRAQLEPTQDWETRFHRLLALGEQLPVLPAAVRIDANRLHGCQATVWVAHTFDRVAGRLYLNCASDTRLVTGLLACLLSGYNGQTPNAALDFDAKSFVQDLSFGGHIASERSNGLLAFIGRARMLAHRYSTQT
ncbi:MAG: SufE family protein [Pseudomonadota bacterium]